MGILDRLLGGHHRINGHDRNRGHDDRHHDRGHDDWRRREHHESPLGKPDYRPVPLRPAVAVACPGCNAAIGVGARFCQQCGTAAPTPDCKCGADLPSGAKFCPQCGSAKI